MNIIHIISSLDPRAGGPVTVLQQLARYQSIAGNEVTICATNAAFPSGKCNVLTNTEMIEDGVRYWYFNVDFLPLIYSSSFKRWLDQNIAGFDIVHIHGLYRFPVTYAGYRARKAEVPYIICPHGSLDPYLYKQSAKSLFLKRLYERFFDLPNLNSASAIHYTAQDEMELASFLKIRAPGIVVPNGLDWAAYASLPLKGAFRARLHLDAATPLILFLGRLNFKKGLDLLISAFAALIETTPDAHLAIVGPDNEGYGKKVRQWCKQYGVENQVFFVDHLPAGQVREAYVDADVFALTSYTENFGMTVAEAMACECPVVISDQVNIWREVLEAGAGLVVPLETEQIVKALQNVLGDSEAASAMGSAGRELVRAEYSWGKLVTELDSVYGNLIAND